MESISKLTQTYIDQHLQIKECLARSLINTSELARQIIKETGLTKFNAILVAANRYSEKLKALNQEVRILKLLKKSKLHIKTKVCRFVFAAHAHVEDDIEPIHAIKGVATTTVIVDQEHFEEIAERYEHYVLDEQKDLVEIAIVSPSEADVVLGVSAFLSNILASKGINILTILGSYTDDVFIIKSEDLAAALSVFEKVVG